MTRLLRRLLTVALTVSLVLVGQSSCTKEVERDALVVFAAVSLADVLQRIGHEFTRTTGIEVRFSFAASSALAKQIESGAQADVFASADQEWMDYLEQEALIQPNTRTDLLGNRLALIAPQESTVALELAPGAPLLAALGPRGRLSVGDPDAVPAGKYAKEALTALRIWESLEPRLVRAENVRAALMYVARGEAPLGIVYATDARAASHVKIVALFPESSHTTITYPVATTSDAHARADSFISFLRSPQAHAIFKDAGFEVLNSDS